MSKKRVLTVRHMEDVRDDHVARYLGENGFEQTHVNPALGIPMPNDPDEYDALLIYGGIQSANDGPDKAYIDEELEWLSNWLSDKRPTLGICLGAQLIAKSLGATVAPHPHGLREIGFHEVTPTAPAQDFLPSASYFYQWHREGFTLPDDCELLAEGRLFPNQAFRYHSNTYGIQFHPEVTRPVMKDWLNHGSTSLIGEGVPSAERQLEDESRYGEKMGNWCRNFLNNWVANW